MSRGELQCDAWGDAIEPLGLARAHARIKASGLKNSFTHSADADGLDRAIAGTQSRLNQR